VVDRDGLAVSLIQSNASGFGSHLFEPSTGVGLHNRGLGFTLDPGHPARYGPRRRPPHTLSPTMVSELDGGFAACVGTMGGDAQPQLLLQVLARLLHHRSQPGTAVGSPRWALTGPSTGFDTWTGTAQRVEIEADAPPAWFDDLTRRGHQLVEVPAGSSAVGHCQVIARTADGFLAGAADPRSGAASAAGF
jgi:gamma-glutamyltranspeptidase/glutathione hydrolase